VKTSYLIWLAFGLFLSACASNPVSKKQEFVLMSEKQELALGQQLAAQYRQQLSLLAEDSAAAQYVNQVGQRLATVADRPELFYHFYVVDDATINAFALPGGHIFIHRGLLNHLNNEAELAAVLGHEIGHVTARHAVRRYTQIQSYQMGMAITSIFVPIPQAIGNISKLLATSFISGFGREQELQADLLALKYAPKAGYDPHAVIALLSTLQRLEHIRTLEKKDAGEKSPEYHGAFATHPETSQRIKQAAAQAERQHQDGFINHHRMLAVLDGLVYGENPKQGAVIGQRFIHPDLKLQLKFPKAWLIHNSNNSLNAKIRKKQVFFTLSLKNLNKRQSTRQVIEQLFKAKNIIRLNTGTTLGYPSAHARILSQAPKVRHAMIDATVWLKGSQAFVMLMWANEKDFSLYQKDFSAIRASLKSYHQGNAGVPRLHLHIWHASDTWQGLAKQSKHILGRFTADKLAALNGMDLTEQPSTGTLIKTVQ